MQYTYYPKGVCSKRIDVEINDGIIENINIEKGCDGNLLGIAKLIKGMPVLEAADKLAGIPCKMKTTSCPDQISIALRQAVAAEKQ